MLTTSFRFPGVLNSQELLVAEAIYARAWSSLANTDYVRDYDETAAKARLGGIIVRLMLDRSRSIGELSAAALSAFRDGEAR